MGNRSRYRGEEEHHATEFICECLRSFGIGEAPANKFALTFAAAATSPWVDTEFECETRKCGPGAFRSRQEAREARPRKESRA